MEAFRFVSPQGDRQAQARRQAGHVQEPRSKSCVFILISRYSSIYTSCQCTGEKYHTFCGRCETDEMLPALQRNKETPCPDAPGPHAAVCLLCIAGRTGYGERVAAHAQGGCPGISHARAAALCPHCGIMPCAYVSSKYRANISSSLSCSRGFARCAFMPQATARSTSSLKALAVMATIGTRFASSRSRERMAVAA